MRDPTDGNRASIITSSPQIPGKEYRISARADALSWYDALGRHLSPSIMSLVLISRRTLCGGCRANKARRSESSALDFLESAYLGSEKEDIDAWFDTRHASAASVVEVTSSSLMRAARRCRWDVDGLRRNRSSEAASRSRSQLRNWLRRSSKRNSRAKIPGRGIQGNPRAASRYGTIRVRDGRNEFFSYTFVCQENEILFIISPSAELTSGATRSGADAR